MLQERAGGLSEEVWARHGAVAPRGGFWELLQIDDRAGLEKVPRGPPAAAAQDQDAVMLCVGNDDDLRSVCLGEEGAFAGMDEGARFVDHTTVAPTVARELAAFAA